MPDDSPTTIVQVTPKSSGLIIVFIGLIFILVAATGYLGYQNVQLQSQIAALKITPTPIISPASPSQGGPESLANVDDATINWKTYTNSKFRYSIRYPDSGVARINCENEDNLFYLVRGIQQDMLEPQNCARDSRFNIEIVASNKQLNNADDRYQSTSSDYQIAGIQAVKYVYTQKPNFEGPGESWFEDIYFEKDGIFYDAYNRNKELSATFDQILSTFTFLP